MRRPVENEGDEIDLLECAARLGSGARSVVGCGWCKDCVNELSVDTGSDGDPAIVNERAREVDLDFSMDGCGGMERVATCDCTVCFPAPALYLGFCAVAVDAGAEGAEAFAFAGDFFTVVFPLFAEALATRVANFDAGFGFWLGEASVCGPASFAIVTDGAAVFIFFTGVMRSLSLPDSAPFSSFARTTARFLFPASFLPGAGGGGAELSSSTSIFSLNLSS